MTRRRPQRALAVAVGLVLLAGCSSAGSPAADDAGAGSWVSGATTVPPDLVAFCAARTARIEHAIAHRDFQSIPPMPRVQLEDLARDTSRLDALIDAAPEDLRSDLTRERTLGRQIYDQLLAEWGDDGSAIISEAHQAGYFDAFEYVIRHGIGSDGTTQLDYDQLRGNDTQRAAVLCGALTPLPLAGLDRPPTGRVAFDDLTSNTLSSVDATGSDPQPVPLAIGVTKPRDVTISPDQRHLAYLGTDSAANGSGRSVLVVADPDGSNARTLDTGGLATCPRWSPDSAHLVVGRLRPQDQVRIVGLDGSVTPIPLDLDDSTCAVFLAASTIAYGRFVPADHQIALWAAQTDGTGQHQLVAVPRCAPSGVAVSPDGSTIALSAGCADLADSGIYEMAADGSNLRRVLKGVLGAFSWSPDSRYLAIAYVEPPARRDHPKVIVATADGTQATELTPAATSWPAWFVTSA